MQNIKQHLEQRVKSRLFRARKTIANKHIVNFSNNDYLNLSSDNRLIDAAYHSLKRFGISTNASPLVCGYTQEHYKLEQQFAEFLNRERALLLANGYIANISILTTLPHRHDIILQDRYCHSSLLEGARLSDAKNIRYCHNQPLDLQQLLSQYKDKNCYITSDSVFSTTGQIADVKLLSQLAKENQAMLVIDDAHGIGILGETGKGICEDAKLTQKQLPIVVCPLGKAFGCYGAIIAGSNDLIEFLIQFSKSYIYSTATPASFATAAHTSLNIIKNEQWRRQKLSELSEYFHQTSKTLGLQFIHSQTPIKSLIIRDINDAILLQNKLLNDNFQTTLLRPPSSGEKYSLLRISLSCRHNKKQISTLLQSIREHHVTT
ncbi:MAG: 8-amino-7-oxononanoate synthase [Gammaproteobacteria bacterium]|nr:8-amino-7-oxononanoate synthase [Gammaproteobacteria bacterium]MCH9743572.1 8-amino-7-oxononanoate synthase [Gammaproteobacteria bacterium]